MRSAMNATALATSSASAAHRDFMRGLGDSLSILADLSRSDVLACCPVGDRKAVVVAHAQPHSIQPLHRVSLEGSSLDLEDAGWILRGLQGRTRRGFLDSSGGTTVVRDVLPIQHQGDLIGVLSVESGVLAYERHRHRSKVFQRFIRLFQQMVLRGELEGAEGLSPFGEHDGIIVVDAASRIRYMSGIATNLYRRLGYSDRLLNRTMASLETADGDLIQEALGRRQCVEREAPRRQFTWACKAIPLLSRPQMSEWQPFALLRRSPQLAGAILTIHDATADRQQEQQLKVQAAMIQEIHHRVKNNLQIISSLLRIQARRVSESEARGVLEETINRILSIAVVHEFLSLSEETSINIRDVSQRIISQTLQGIGNPSKRIRLEVSGPSVSLAAQRATVCALVINELVQNALQHAFEERGEGFISVQLEDNGEQIVIRVHDNGEGLEPAFDVMRDGSLGLRIVHTLVQDDLGGTFELRSSDGVEAVATFPKIKRLAFS